MSLYKPFLALLSSPLDSTKPAVPSSTLFPAISHFLSSLPPGELIRALVFSPYLWPSSSNLALFQNALRKAVALKVTASRRAKAAGGEGVGGKLLGLLWRRRGSERELTLDQWTRLVLEGLTEEKTVEQVDKREEKLLVRLAGLAGLSEGLTKEDAKIGKGSKGEIDVVLLVLLEDEFRRVAKGKRSDTGEHAASLPSVFLVAASVFPLVPLASLRALDLKSIIGLATYHLPSSSSTSISPDELSCLITVLTISLEAIAASWRSRSALLQPVLHRLDAFSKMVAPSWDPSEADLYIQSYLLPLSSTLVSLSLNHPSLPSPDLSRTLLVVWLRLSPHTYRLGGLEGLERYGRMWWGLVDLWLGQGKGGETMDVVLALRSLKAELKPEEEGALERANYYLIVVEQVLSVVSVAKLEEGVVQELVLDVVEPHLDDDSNVEVLESAHSVMLALLAPPKRPSTLALPPTDSSLLGRMAINYSDRILKSANASALTSEQTQYALSLLLPLLLNISPALPLSILYKLHQSASTSPRILSLFASLLPFIPVPLLPRYLVQLEDVLLKATEPRSDERKEVVRLVWEGVGAGGKLSDEVRNGVGRWWEEMRARLRAEERNPRGAKAREAKL